MMRWNVLKGDRIMSVKEFYDQLLFPGYYKLEQLQRYEKTIKNKYLRIIDQELSPGQRVLDAGCGTGLISNLFALRYPTSQFVGVDFADGVNWAREFAQINGINNIEYYQEDLSKIKITQQYDRVICQGVLHHIPDYRQTLAQLTQAIKPGGRLILGLYHPWGKILKKYISVNYSNNILEQDQENNPSIGLSFNQQQVIDLLPDFTLQSSAPSIFGKVALSALLHSQNGGLITYVFEKRK